MTLINSISNKDDLDRANQRLDELIHSPDGSPERDEYRSLFMMVSEFQDTHFPVEIPDGIGMIEFHLENTDLKTSDLVPLIGSKKKVAEVMSGKSPLTVPMIRALNKHLGVDLESLVGYEMIDEEEGIDWTKFPTDTIRKLDWFSDDSKTDKELVEQLIRYAGGLVKIPRAYCRKNFDARRNALTNIYSLQAWCQKVVGDALTQSPTNRFDKTKINQDFVDRIALLSLDENGPRKAIDALTKVGIVLVHVDPLPEMYVDCAVMKAKEGFPVIGLTLRDDNIDSFWFSVLHAVAHIWKHLSAVHYFFVDDFNIKECQCNVDWSIENEADRIALEALYPSNDWRENTGNSYYHGRVAAERIKYPVNSITTNVNTNNQPPKQIAKEVETKSLREFF